MRKKKIYFWPGPPSLGSEHIFPRSAWVFSVDSCFFPHRKDVQLGKFACLHFPILRECGCFCECNLQMKGVLSRVSPAWCPELPGEAPPTRTLNWNKWIRELLSDLFLFTLLKCMYSSHVCQMLILEVFGVFI